MLQPPTDKHRRPRQLARPDHFLEPAPRLPIPDTAIELLIATIVEH